MSKQTNVIRSLALMLILSSSLLLLASSASVTSRPEISQEDVIKLQEPESDSDSEEFFDADDDPDWYSSDPEYLDDDEIFYDAVDDLANLPDSVCKLEKQDNCETCCTSNGFKGHSWSKGSQNCLCDF